MPHPRRRASATRSSRGAGLLGRRTERAADDRRAAALLVELLGRAGHGPGSDGRVGSGRLGIGQGGRPGGQATTAGGVVGTPRLPARFSRLRSRSIDMLVKSPFIAPVVASEKG